MNMMEKFQEGIERVLVPLASKTYLCSKGCIYIVISTDNGGIFNDIT